MKKLYFKFVLWWNDWCPKHGIPKHVEYGYEYIDKWCVTCLDVEAGMAAYDKEENEARLRRMSAWLHEGTR